jgi:hypothetical protein
MSKASQVCKRLRSAPFKALLNKQSATGRGRPLMTWGIILLIPLLAGPSFAAPEGTRNIEVYQGLTRATDLLIQADVGDTIQVCSSDDGNSDPFPVHENCLGSPAQCADAPGSTFILDDPTSQTGLLPIQRRGAEIILRPPVPTVCATDVECVDPGTSCRDSVGFLVPDQSAAREGTCAFALEVRSQPSIGNQPRAAEPGFCTAFHTPDSRQWLTHQVSMAGAWTVDFAG